MTPIEVNSSATQPCRPLTVLEIRTRDRRPTSDQWYGSSPMTRPSSMARKPPRGTMVREIVAGVVLLVCGAGLIVMVLGVAVEIAHAIGVI